MKSPVARIALMLGIAALVTALVMLIPTEEDRLKAVIRKARHALSSEDRPGGPLDGLARIGELSGCLTRDVVIQVDVFGLGSGSLNGVDEVRAAAAALPQQFPGLRIQVDEIRVVVDDPVTGHGSFVATTTTDGGKSSGAQEFNVRFRKSEGRWFLSRIETVRTLRQQ
jgi:hypothetical protein